MQTNRTNGAKGALLDEYEKVVAQLQVVLKDIPDTELAAIADPNTQDSDCRSIQTVLAHVIRAGYCYAIDIRNLQGEHLNFPERQLLISADGYIRELDHMFQYNQKVLDDYPNLKLSEKDNDKKILTSWGQLYDVEQLMEHAIVHILRHRRQIEKFLMQLR